MKPLYITYVATAILSLAGVAALIATWKISIISKWELTVWPKQKYSSTAYTIGVHVIFACWLTAAYLLPLGYYRGLQNVHPQAVGAAIFLNTTTAVLWILYALYWRSKTCTARDFAVHSCLYAAVFVISYFVPIGLSYNHDRRVEEIANVTALLPSDFEARVSSIDTGLNRITALDGCHRISIDYVLSTDEEDITLFLRLNTTGSPTLVEVESLQDASSLLPACDQVASASAE